MRDILPADALSWQFVERTLADVSASFAYQSMRLPLVEFTALFKRGVGEATDIVEKEMYTFADNDGESLTLRPEGTASCARALLDAGLLYNAVQRVTYAGPMFRYERPQKGRYRQFEQFGVETFGLVGPDIDAELLLMCQEMWRRLGVSEALTLQLNTLGSGDSRVRYRQALVDYLTPFEAELDADSQRRLKTNPLRILDSKNARTGEIVADAPTLASFVDDDARAHFDGLLAQLDALGIAAQINPTLVRGLDYYTHTVFEWVTDALGAQGTVCGGGRYDGLVELLGGKATPAAGFAAGIDRLVLLRDAVAPALDDSQCDVYWVVPDPSLIASAQKQANDLRQNNPGLRIRLHTGGGKMKNQMKKADASGAQFAFIVGPEESASGGVTVKRLRGEGGQNSMSVADAFAMVAREIQGADQPR